MLFNPAHTNPLSRLSEELRLAPQPTRELIGTLIAGTCMRLPQLAAGKTQRIDDLIEAGAWIEAALAVIAIETPQWKLRRLVLEDGEWLCSLSRLTNLPVELDDTADGRHECAALAVWSAFLEARRMGPTGGGGHPVAPHVRPTSSFAVCCDNFV